MGWKGRGRPKRYSSGISFSGRYSRYRRALREIRVSASLEEVKQIAKDALDVYGD